MLINRKQKRIIIILALLVVVTIVGLLVFNIRIYMNEHKKVDNTRGSNVELALDGSGKNYAAESFEYQAYDVTDELPIIVSKDTTLFDIPANFGNRIGIIPVDTKLEVLGKATNKDGEELAFVRIRYNSQEGYVALKDTYVDTDDYEVEIIETDDGLVTTIYEKNEETDYLG